MAVALTPNSPAKPPGQYSRTRHLGFLLLIFAAGIATYHNSLSVPFVFDDKLIEDNEHIRQLWPPWQAITAPPQFPTKGRPVVSLSFAINYAMGELGVRGYHALNIAVHILCALVLFGIIRRTLLCEALRLQFARVSGGIALACAMIWMVHPLQTECINYITQRTESIMGLFYLLTLYCAIRAIHSDHSRWWYATSIVSCALGMASKEVMVTAPLVVLLYDRVFNSSSFKRALRQRWGLYAGLASTWVILALLMAPGPRSESVGFSLGTSAMDYALSQCHMIVNYLRLVFWPYPLLIDYGYSQPVQISEVIPYAMALAAMLATTLTMLIRRPMIGFMGAWFFMILGPTSSFIPIATEVGAERRMYLPLAGIIVLLVIGGYKLLQYLARRPWEQKQPVTSTVGGLLIHRVGIGLVVAVIALSSRTSMLRNEDYHDAVLLWQDAVVARPNSRRAHFNLGNALKSEGNLEEAIIHYRHAIRIDPNYVEAYNNLGAVFILIDGKLDEAIAHYRQAIKIEPNHIQALNNLGNALTAAGKIDEAIDSFQRALQIESDYAGAHFNLGVALHFQDEYTEAIKHYREALRIKPGYINAHNNLGAALKSQGKFDEAIGHYLVMLEDNPDDAEAHNNLGNALRSRGDLEEAVSHYRKAVRLDPDFAIVRNNLGNAFYSQGRFDEAREQYQQALRLNHKSAEALTNLGLLLQMEGRLDEAFTHYQKAVAAEPDYADAHHNLGNLLQAKGMIHDAISHYRQALELDPQLNETHNNLGNALLSLGKIAEAIDHFRAAIRIDPSVAETYNSLGVSLQLQGHVGEAIRYYRQALKLKPDYTEARKNLEIALATDGSPAESPKDLPEPSAPKSD